MLLAAVLAALVAGRLGARWRSTPGFVEIDDRLHRDVGSPPIPVMPSEMSGTRQPGPR